MNNVINFEIQQIILHSLTGIEKKKKKKIYF